jgi:hypothetical protein
MGSSGFPWVAVGRKNSIHRPFLLPGRVKRLPASRGWEGVSMIRWAGRAIAAWTKPRTDLIVENLCLRQQLIVRQRRAPRPRLRDGDRRFWILSVGGSPHGATRSSSSNRTPCSAGIAGDGRPIGGGGPATKKGGRPPLPRALRALIRRMAVENRLWGQRRVQAELARLGFPVGPDHRQVHSHQPGRCQSGSRAGAGPPRLRRGRPVPLILPSAPRLFGQSGTSGRVGAARRPRQPGWADAGPRLEAISPEAG